MKISTNWAGIGPKLALINLPFIILSIIIIFRYPDFFNLRFLDHNGVRILAFLWLAIGLVFWGASAVWFLKYFKQGNLITTGPFALCRNPIYSSIIVFIIPAIGLILHSGLILSIALVLYITLRISIHGEEVVLLRLFGEEYEAYRRTVNNVFPFPNYIFRKKLELQRK